MMTTALQTASWTEPKDLDGAARIAQTIYDSRLAPKALTSPSAVLVAMMAGAPLGLHPMQAVATIHVVEGRPVLSAQLIAACAMRDPECEYWHVVESNDARCIIEAKRRSSPGPTRVEWNEERAKVAGLAGKQNWQRHRGQMLARRASKEIADLLFPGAVLGVITEEDIDDVRASADPMPVAAAFAVPTRATTQPVAEHKQIMQEPAPLILTPDAEPAKVETRAPEGEATKASAADDLTAKVNRIGKLVHPFMPDEMRPAELRSAIRKFSTDDIDNILTECEAATRDPDEGDALLRALAGDVLRGPADA